jgi:hypothetical protein
MPVANDKFGRVLHVTRFSGSLRTEYREDGYYWSHVNSDAWTGPFETREAAKAHERASATRKRRG